MTLQDHPAPPTVWGQGHPPNVLRMSRKTETFIPNPSEAPSSPSFTPPHPFCLLIPNTHSDRGCTTAQSPKHVLAFAHVSPSHQNAVSHPALLPPDLPLRTLLRYHQAEFSSLSLGVPNTLSVQSSLCSIYSTALDSFALPPFCESPEDKNPSFRSFSVS